MQKDWKERLHNWAPEPPQGGWERLSDALPQEQQPAYAQKLFDFAAPPPPAVWDDISKELNGEQTLLPVIQMYPRKKWLQVASIAASLLFAVYFLPPLFRSGGQTTAPASTPVVQQGMPTVNVPTNALTVPPAETTPIATAASNEQPAVYVANVPLPPKDNAPLRMATTERASSVLRSWLPENEDVPHVGNFIDRYIILPVTEDAAVRLPKKLYAAFRCEEQADPSGCWERLAALRRQMAAPEQLASADFLGVMEVVQNMGSLQ